MRSCQSPNYGVRRTPIIVTSRQRHRGAADTERSTQRRSLSASRGHARIRQVWYEEQRAGLGRLFAAAVETTIAAILENPAAYPGVYGDTRRALKILLVAVVAALLPGVATSADSPPAMYIDKGACPFECCTYRAWNATADTVVHAKPDKNAQVVGLVKAGAIVEAITGEVHSRPVAFVVKKPHAEYTPGDVLWVYTYLGEGHFKVWRSGAMHEEDLGFSPHGGSPGARCENREQCWGEIKNELKSSWWVKVRSKEGWEGWSNEPEHFGNKDACG